MGRVTIKELYWELSSDEMLRNFIWDGCKDIEVIPRKIAERIIEKCEEIIKKQEHVLESYDPDSYISGNALAVRLSMMQLKEYAESLLKQFEEEILTDGEPVASLQDNRWIVEPGRTMTTEQIIDHLQHVKQELSEARGSDYSGVLALEEAIKELSSVLDKQKVLAMLDFADNALTDEVRTVENFKALLVECIQVMPTSRSTGK